MQIIQASAFGVIPGNEVSAELRALAEHIESLEGDCYVEFTAGNYTVDKIVDHHYGDPDAQGKRGRHQYWITLRDIKNVFLSMTGVNIEYTSTFTSHYDDPLVLGGTQWAWAPGGILLENCSNVQGWGAKLVGGSETVTRGNFAGTGSLHAELDSHGICFRGSDDCIFRDMEIEGFTTDGVIMDGQTVDGVFKHSSNCQVWRSTFHKSCRNGITTAEAVGGYFLDCTVTDTGSGTYTSHSPVCGIDVEPDLVPDPADPSKPDDWAGRHTFKRCHVSGEDALRTFVAYWKKNRGVFIDECEFIGGAADSGYGFYLFCPDAVMTNSKVYGMLSTVGAHEGEETIVDACEFYVSKYSAPFGRLNIGDAGALGSVRFSRNYVENQVGNKAAHIYAPYSRIDNNHFHNGPNAVGNWLVTIGTGTCVETELEGNEFTSDKPGTKVRLEGLDNDTVLGPNVTSV